MIGKPGTSRKNYGFTLVELLTVLLLLSILAAVSTPVVVNAITRSKEAALLKDIRIMRELIDDYYADFNQYPESLNDMVEKGYLRKIPVNPFSEQESDWSLVTNNRGGITDVYSRYEGLAMDGSNYRDW